MSKWHINKRGIPALCKAEKGKCPLGEHFETENEAGNAIGKQMENEFGLLPPSRMSVERKRDIAELIKRISGTNATGFDYECYASLSIAEEMGLNRVAITDENGLTVNISTDNDSKQINANVFVDRSVEAVSNYYKKMGVPISNKDALARVVYYSDDISKGALVQSGGPNVLDAAIIKADEVVDIVEVKELENGAQMPSNALNVEKDGTISEETLNAQNPKVRKALEGLKIQDADGKDLKLDFGGEEENKTAPLYYFVEEYRKKGATAFIYTSDNGETVNKIDLTGESDEVVQRLIDNKIEANLSLRANLNKKDVNEDDIYRFNNVLSKKYFKSGRASTSETFTLKGIKEEKIKKAGEFVRVGGYIIPIKYDEYKDNMNKRIKKTDMKAFGLVLTGRIKTNY